MKKILGAGVLAAALLLAPAAHAASSPSTVSVEVEGAKGPTLAQIPATTFAGAFKPKTTDGQPAAGTCSGTSAGGALQAATGGDWTGTDSSFGYSVDAIKGEALPFSSGKYWAFYVNGAQAQVGACSQELQPSDRVQFYAACASATSGCYAGEPMQLTAPAVVRPGTPFKVSLTESTTTFDAQSNATSKVAPSAGASIAGQTTAADGTATIALNGSGPQVVTATKGTRPPAAATVCVTTGSDGQCGSGVPSAIGQPAPCVSNGSDGLCGSPDKVAPFAKVVSVTEGKRFAKGKAPRILSGSTDNDPSGIRRVTARLARTDGKRCARYDAKREKFVSTKRCGVTHASFFQVATQQAWSYQLPSALSRGRYVLDVRVTDGKGNASTTAQRGRNRIVFFVS